MERRRSPERVAEFKRLTWRELVEHCTNVLVRNGANPTIEPVLEPPRRCLECGHLMGRRPQGTRGRKPLYHRHCRDQMHLRRQRVRRQQQREEERGCASAVMHGTTLRSGGESIHLTLTVPSSGAA